MLTETSLGAIRIFFKGDRLKHGSRTRQKMSWRSHSQARAANVDPWDDPQGAALLTIINNHH